MGGAGGMMMYICLSCYQLKQGDEKRLDLNICEDCASDKSDEDTIPDQLPEHMFIYSVDSSHKKNLSIAKI